MDINDLRSIVTVAGLLCFLAHDFDELLWIERLDQPAGRPGRAPLRLHRVGRLGRQHQDRRRSILRCGTQVANQGQAIHARHVLIGQHQVDAARLRLVQAILSVDRLDHFVTGTFQRE
jgi:hypothetical protein